MEALKQLQKTLEERERNYSDPFDNFERIARFTALLDEVPNGPTKIAMEGIMWKMARLVFAIKQGKAYPDGWRDCAGYAILGERVHAEELRRQTLKGKLLLALRRHGFNR